MDRRPTIHGEVTFREWIRLAEAEINVGVSDLNHERRKEIDPDACFSMILENIVHKEWSDAAENAENLRNWMDKGGFPPGGGRLRKTSINALLKWLIAHPNRDD